MPAQSPLPPGIFGYREGREGINRYVYDWVDGAPRRKPIEYARKLLAEAGYPNGRDAKTGEPLLINLDTTATGVGSKSRLDWYTRQFENLGVQLVVRSTDYNRFQDKLRKGNVQLYFLGWNADYPDPENFLFLVLTNPADGQEDEYNRWYNDEHIDDVLAVPGFVGVQRFRLTPHPAMPAPEWRYLAFYEVDRARVREAFEELAARGGTDRMPVSPALKQEGIQVALYHPVAVKTKTS